MYNVKVTNREGSCFKVKSKEYEFIVDLKGDGITPPDTLLAALASCIGVYIRKYCEGAKLTLGELEITAEADLTKESPVCFRNIRVSISIKDAKLDERRRKALLEFAKNCPVHNTLHNNPEIDIELAS